MALAIALTGAGALLLFRPLRSGMGNVTGIPWQVHRIATDPRLRRNHALEHATLNVMERKFGRPEINGVAVQAGFILRGWVNPAQAVASAEEGLRRLQLGQSEFAFHPQCGTSLGTAELITWVTLVALLLLTGRLSWAGLAAGVAVTYLVAPWAGRIVQRRLTTTTDLAGVSIAGATMRPLAQPRGSRRARRPAPGEFWGEVLVVVRHPGDQVAGFAAGSAGGGGLGH